MLINFSLIKKIYTFKLFLYNKFNKYSKTHLIDTEKNHCIDDISLENLVASEF